MNRVDPTAVHQAEEAAALAQQLALQPLYKRPPPVWLHPSFLSQYDAFLDGTGMAGGALPENFAVLGLALERLLEDQSHLLSNLDGHQVRISLSVSQSVREDLCRRDLLLLSACEGTSCFPQRRS